MRYAQLFAANHLVVTCQIRYPDISDTQPGHLRHTTRTQCPTIVYVYSVYTVSRSIYIYATYMRICMCWPEPGSDSAFIRSAFNVALPPFARLIIGYEAEIVSFIFKIASSLVSKLRLSFTLL